MVPLRVLLVHNRYQQYGGEDSVVDVESRLLREAGHQVDTFFVTNDAIAGVAATLKAASFTIYNPFARRGLRERLRASRPDVVHVHNFFPQLSPSIFDACADENLPVVMTLHNFRVGCANGLLFRDGRPCEDCLHGSPYQAVLHRCYRSSRAGSAAVASMIAAHRHLHTWHRKVTRYIALTNFSRDKLALAGIPLERMRVKPNVVADPLHARPALPDSTGTGAVFVGRLSPEKGVATAIEAWRGLKTSLRVVGGGPDLEILRARASEGITFLGQCDREQVYREIAEAAVVVVPSIWYENFPVAVVEAMAMGKPILASRLGALPEIVRDGVEGLLFQPGDAEDLREVAARLMADPDLLATLGRNARSRYLSELSPADNLDRLVAIYAEAIAAITPA